MKLPLACMMLLWVALPAFSQTKELIKYKERAEIVRQDIWGNAEDAFKRKDIPADMTNESAVVIARTYDIVNSMKTKLKLTLFVLGAAKRMSYANTIHERVMINDKAALEEYSTLEYKKKIDKTTHIALTKIYNKTDTYVGAKIIKPSGKEIIIDTDEEVLTKDEKNDKDGKLAISGLQVGDILDYYIDTEEIQETGSEVQGPYTFVMGGEYPVLYYKVRLQLDKRAGVKYIAANGAPSFQEAKTEDDDLVLELEQKNLPKFQSTTWTSPYRQYAYIILQYKLVTGYPVYGETFKAGVVKKGVMSDDLVKQYREAIQPLYTSVNFLPLTYTYDYFGGKKKIKNFSKDTLIKILFESWRYVTYCSFSTEKIDMSNDINYQRTNSLTAAIAMSHYLQALELDHDIILVAGRNDASLKNAMSIGDIEAMVRVELEGKAYWMSFNDITTQFNEIPARFQGEEAVTLHGERIRKTYDFEQGKIKIPVGAASENVVSEKINISFNPATMQQLQMDRTCTITGALRNSEQKRLLLMQEMEKKLAGNINQKTFAERIADGKKGQKMAAEFASAFEKEKKDWDKYFKEEIQQQFDEEPKQVTGNEIITDGLLGTSPALIYHSNFALDNFVKKAGNNYILEIGKLIGKYNKLEEKERTRTIDVYMSCARTFTWTMNLNIPEGYTIKGAEDLDKIITNETGSVMSKATIEGSSVKIFISRSFNKNFEQVSAWPKLVALLDGVYEIYGKKILLEKKK